MKEIPEIEKKRLSDAADKYASQFDEPYQERAAEDHYCGGAEEYIASAEREKKQAIAFLKWHNKLSDADRCTVWPPDGDGAIGLYNNSKENLYEKFLRSHKQIKQL